jgi:hypothetical protein
VFFTKEIADLSGGSTSVATRVLTRMARDGFIQRVVRGLWCVPSDPRFSRFTLIHYLSRGHPSYLSFLSALHLHGLIEQIPQTVYAATTGHTRLVNTVIGGYSFHRIAPTLFGGFDWYGEQRNFLVATAEKALVDSLYLSSRKGQRFRFFPEIEIPPGFSFPKAQQWVERISDPLIKTYVIRHLDDLRKKRPRQTSRRPARRRSASAE